MRMPVRLIGSNSTGSVVAELRRQPRGTGRPPSRTSRSSGAGSNPRRQTHARSVFHPLDSKDVGEDGRGRSHEFDNEIALLVDVQQPQHPATAAHVRHEPLVDPGEVADLSGRALEGSRTLTPPLRFIPWRTGSAARSAAGCCRRNHDTRTGSRSGCNRSWRPRRDAASPRRNHPLRLPVALKSLSSSARWRVTKLYLLPAVQTAATHADRSAWPVEQEVGSGGVDGAGRDSWAKRHPPPSGALPEPEPGCASLAPPQCM